MLKSLTIKSIVKIYRAHKYKSWQRDFFDTRKSDGIIFFTEGSIKYHFNHKDIIAKAGDILFLPGNLPYSGQKLCESISFIGIDFLCNEEDDFEKLGAPCVINTQNFNNLLAVFSNLSQSWNNQLLSSEFEAKSFIYSVLSEIFKQTENIRNVAPTDEILAYIAGAISSPSLSLTQICKRFYISESQLRRNVIKRTGLSPVEYITALRIGKAKNELMNSEKSIKTIAYECGFRSQNYFSRVFTKSVGMSPAEFKTRSYLLF